MIDVSTLGNAGILLAGVTFGVKTTIDIVKVLKNGTNGKVHADTFRCGAHENLSTNMAEVRTTMTAIHSIVQKTDTQVEEVFNRLREVETRIAVLER